MLQVLKAAAGCGALQAAAGLTSPAAKRGIQLLLRQRPHVSHSGNAMSLPQRCLCPEAYARQAAHCQPGNERLAAAGAMEAAGQQQQQGQGQQGQRKQWEHSGELAPPAAACTLV